MNHDVESQDHRQRWGRRLPASAERGGFPLAQIRADEPWNDLADDLEETAIRRVLQHDLRPGDGEAGDPRILEEVFRIACRYAGQDPGPKVFVPEIRAAVGLAVGWRRVVEDLHRLADSLLLRRIPPLELRLRRRQQRHKLCLCDPSLRAAWLREPVPLTADALAAAPGGGSRLAGALAESIVGALLASIPGLGVAWSPGGGERPELDFVVTVGDRRIPIEVKYRRKIDPVRDIAGLAAFIDREINQAPFGLLVTLDDEAAVADPRVVSLPLESLLLLR